GRDQSFRGIGVHGAAGARAKRCRSSHRTAETGDPLTPTEPRMLKPGDRLLVASHNRGKVSEILALLAPHGLTVASAAELGLPEPEETGATFEENALIKARAAAEASGLPALADDSGL